MVWAFFLKLNFRFVDEVDDFTYGLTQFMQGQLLTFNLAKFLGLA